MDWLPELILFEDYDGDWHHYEDALYAAFSEDFIYSAPTFDGRRVGPKRHPMFRQREWTFWHIISEGPVEAERDPDFRRCECVKWPRAIIDNARAKGLLCWTSDRGEWRDRILIGLPDFSYIVVLVDKASYFLLLTAYCVETSHRRLKLEAEWERNKV